MIFSLLALLALQADTGHDSAHSHAGHDAPASHAAHHAAPSAREAEVAARGGQVMPFDLERSTHRFNPTDDGGVQRVVSDDADAAQVALIRTHLREEADRFARGNFASPAAIHGADMPGLAALAAAGKRLSVRFVEIPSGAELHFTSAEPAVIKAVHDWFTAQVRDHGAHAR